MMTIDIALPTQEFRDNLIKLIFKDEILWKELSDEYEAQEGEVVNNELVQSEESPEEFVQHVKEFRKNNDTSKKIERRYKNKVDKKKMQKLENAPIALCDEIIDRLKQINLQPYLDATSTLADEKLRTIKAKLDNAAQWIEDIEEKIKKKINFDE